MSRWCVHHKCCTKKIWMVYGPANYTVFLLVSSYLSPNRGYCFVQPLPVSVRLRTCTVYDPQQLWVQVAWSMVVARSLFTQKGCC